MPKKKPTFTFDDKPAGNSRPLSPIMLRCVKYLNDLPLGRFMGSRALAAELECTPQNISNGSRVNDMSKNLIRPDGWHVWWGSEETVRAWHEEKEKEE